MGWFFDFAKRRIAGYIVFWILVILLVVVVFKGDVPAQAGGLFVLGFAFLGSLLYTRRMKRKQRARRDSEDQSQRIQQWQQAQSAQQMQMQQVQQAQQAPRVQQTRPPGGR